LNERAQTAVSINKAGESKLAKDGTVQEKEKREKKKRKKELHS
jgi:hypothetical protein